MKKNNEKGFLLAEAIVVGVFVLSLFVFLFVNVVPLVGKYEEYEKYDTIDGVYNANMVRAMIMEDDNMNKILELGSEIYKAYTPEVLCNNLVKKNYCKVLLGKSYLNVKKVYVTWYRLESNTGVGNGIKKAAKEPKNSIEFDRATSDYIDSLDSFSTPAGDTYKKYHRLIIQYDDDSFANIEVKVSEG